MYRSIFLGSGYYAPEKVLTNDDLSKIVDTSDEWISTRTGIRRRHIAADGESTSDMAYKAAEMAIKNAGIETTDIDLIIIATVTPDTKFPSTACWLQKRLGIEECLSFDIAGACSGFIYGLTIADSLIKTGARKTALVIGAEVLNHIVDWTDRGTCILFGDGAGAMLLQGKESERGLLSHDIGSDVDGIELLRTPAGGSRIPYSEKVLKEHTDKIVMEGNRVFKIATRTMVKAVKNAMAKADLTGDDIDYFIPHQANVRIINYVAKSLKVPDEKVIINLDEYGNTSAASIPIAIAEAMEKGILKKGHRICCFAFGAGFTYGSIVLDL